MMQIIAFSSYSFLLLLISFIYVQNIAMEWLYIILPLLLKKNSKMPTWFSRILLLVLELI